MQTLPLDLANISDLRSALKGRVITSDEAEYDKARSVFYGGIDRRPALIVRVATTSDVSQSVANSVSRW